MKKINFHCDENASQYKITLHVDGFLDVTVPYDVPAFFKLQEQQKKEEVLELLLQSLLFVAREKEWNPQPFYQAYEAVKKQNYRCLYTWKKTKASPNRKYKAKVECELTTTDAVVKLVVLNKEQTQTLKEVIVTTTESDEALFDMYLGEIKWVSSSEVRLYRKYTRNPEIMRIFNYRKNKTTKLINRLVY